MGGEPSTVSGGDSVQGALVIGGKEMEVLGWVQHAGRGKGGVELGVLWEVDNSGSSLEGRWWL